MAPVECGATQETAEALLEGGDTAALRCVLRARGHATETRTADEVQAALDCDPDWLTTGGADRLIRQLHEPATDEDAGVRDEAQRIPATLRPREERAQEQADGTA
ncbi:hypothetical protein ACFZDG_12435 [Kitasatospora xanthocidica]|uniref:hypothetical protein n=1 Tax=Kitasatospora xanthocidica TaxID=83382 RepID=UPI0036EB2B9C